MARKLVVAADVRASLGLLLSNEYVSEDWCRAISAAVQVLDLTPGVSTTPLRSYCIVARDRQAPWRCRWRWSFEWVDAEGVLNGRSGYARTRRAAQRELAAFTDLFRQENP